MIVPCNDVERRLDELAEHVRLLELRLDELTGRRAEVGLGKKMISHDNIDARVVMAQPPVEEEVISWAGKSALLPRIAVICFVLVVALILRTITDNEVINLRVGSLLGMTYAIALIGWGWRLYAKNSRLAPVFPSCGLLLLLSVVLEAHGRFESLSTFGAYLTLLATGMAVTVIGFRFRASFLLCLATLGSGLAAMAIDFPYPHFPLLAVILLGANVSGFLAHRKQVCPSLRWTAFGLTFLFWLFWSFKLNIPAACDEPSANILHLNWFFPTLLLFVLFYIGTAIRNVLAEEPPQGFFDGLLPTVSGVGAFFAAWAVVIPWYRSTTWLVITGLVFSALHFVITAWLAGRGREGAPGSNTFAFAGAAFFVMSLTILSDSLGWILPFWSASAYGLTRLSGRWGSGGVRITSYLLQVAAFLIGTSSGALTLQGGSFAGAFIGSAAVAVCSLLQYQWCRNNRPAYPHSAYFSWFDKKDISAAMLLVVGLVCGYYFLQLGFFVMLDNTSSSFEAVFKSGKSIFINAGSVLLLLAALRKKSIELLALACVIAGIGAIKVFILDLFSIKGVPLVLSVFSFGILAAVGSVVSTRWQKKIPLTVDA